MPERIEIEPPLAAVDGAAAQRAEEPGDQALAFEALGGLVRQASEMSGRPRAEQVDVVCDQLLRLGREVKTRAAADFVKARLESGELAELVDSEGRTARAVAVEALLAMGFPYALEVAPEDLAHLRQGGMGRARLAGLLSGVLLVAALSALEILSTLGGGPRWLVWAHAGMALAAVGAAAVTRPGTDARRWSLAALMLAGVEGVALGLLGGDTAPLIAGVASLASTALISRAR